MATKKARYTLHCTRYLKNKRVLITAGPTWVPIDSVRVISNSATGKTGILLAEELRRLGAKVTLLLGAVEACCLSDNIRLVRFKFFEELKAKLKKELALRKYSIVIHSAAVSDFRPAKIYSDKISSKKRDFLLRLKPTVKLIGLIKKARSSLFIVAFKFKPQAKKKDLIREAKIMQNKYACRLVVANTIYHGHYLAYLLGEGAHLSGPLYNKKQLVRSLIKAIQHNL